MWLPPVPRQGGHGQWSVQAVGDSGTVTPAPDGAQKITLKTPNHPPGQLICRSIHRLRIRLRKEPFLHDIEAELHRVGHFRTAGRLVLVDTESDTDRVKVPRTHLVAALDAGDCALGDAGRLSEGRLRPAS